MKIIVLHTLLSQPGWQADASCCSSAASSCVLQLLSICSKNACWEDGCVLQSMSPTRHSLSRSKAALSTAELARKLRQSMLILSIAVRHPSLQSLHLLPYVPGRGKCSKDKSLNTKISHPNEKSHPRRSIRLPSIRATTPKTTSKEGVVGS